MADPATAPALPDHQRDPWRLCLAIAAAFFLLAVWRLGTPSTPMFDEIHYLPAVRHLLALSSPVNQEHPLVAKEAMAIGWALFGDNAFGWRIVNAALGTIGLYAAMRALWWASRSRVATLLFGVLMATNFIWFILSRIAMLDMTMAAALAIAFWQCALAMAKEESTVGRRRLHLALAGLFLGLSLGAKWNGIPVLVLPGLGFALARWDALGPGRRREWFTARNVGPVRGVSLTEAALWLGSLPLLVYFASFAPMFLYKTGYLGSPAQLLPYQETMLRLQDSVTKPHRYMSRWWQWMFNLRPIWFLYQDVDGARRGVLMIGNPFTMLAALPALALCAWHGFNNDRLRGGLFLLYLGALVFWALNGKPVQFYYHYELAAVFACAALAVVLADWWEDGKEWPAWTVGTASAAMFAVFYPIIAALPLAGKSSYLWWMWLDSWR